MTNEGLSHCTLGKLGSQHLQVTFDGERVVSDTGLLLVRAVEKPLRVIAELAQRLPDPRSPQFLHHTVETILTQQVYQILAGYPDHDDANTLRHDPLHQILTDIAPDADSPLASGSTLARFAYAFTRRQAERPLEERPVLLEVRHAQCQRLTILNQYLAELFVRTRTTPPAEVILDIDATDDPTHGHQALSGYHGYFGQHQYFPLLVFEGATGFPLAAWLRPGTGSAALGAVDVLRPIVAALRAAWPGVRITVRGDTGFAVPAVYDFCEAENLEYVLGYAGNAVLLRRTDQALTDLRLYHRLYGRREPRVQRFEEIRGYQAGGWPHPRRVICKVEVTPEGSQRRFVVSNRPEAAEALYREVYVQRGAVPEQPIGELKNGLRADRLSSCGFCANAFRLLLHVLAYAIVVLFRQACASVADVATASVETLRARLWKVGAVLVSRPRLLRLRVSATWPGVGLWGAVWEATQGFVTQVTGPRRVGETPGLEPLS
jgi:hypothetical protein